MGIPNKIIRLVKMTIDNTNSKENINGAIPESFESTVELRRWESLSTTLFNKLA